MLEAGKRYAAVLLLHHVRLFAIPWTAARWASLYVGFPRQKYPSGSADRIYLQCRRHRRCEFDPWVRKIPWRRKWRPTPVFLPGKFHKRRSLKVYSPWGHKESDNRARSTGRSGGIFLVKGKSIRQFSTRGKQDNSAGK